MGRRVSFWLATSLVVSAALASCAQGDTLPGGAGGDAGSEGDTATSGHAGASSVSGSGGGMASGGGTAGSGGAASSSSSVASSSSGGTMCDSFCGGCACPSPECTMCCVQEMKLDVCSNGLCGCF